jgi:hypothetical protein
MSMLVWILGFALEPYILSSILVGFVYFSWTPPSATVSIVNQLRASASIQTNHLLRQYGIIFLCHDILELRMERAKSKLLELIHTSYKLDMIRTILEYDTASTASTASTSPSKLSVSSTTSSIGSIPSPDRKWSKTFANWRSSEKQENATPVEINLVV